MNKLKLLRLNKGLTQMELAKELHIVQSAISKWEKGKTIPDIETLKKLSNFYNVSIEELLQETSIETNIDTNFIKAKINRPLTNVQRKCINYIVNLNELRLEKAEAYLNALYNIDK